MNHEDGLLGRAAPSEEGTGQAPVLSWAEAIVLQLVLGSVLCFFGLGSHGVISMEGMVVDGAEHMLATRQWIVPYVYDELYTFKPALAYWHSAAVQAVARDLSNGWVLRAPFAANVLVLGLLVVLVVGRATEPATGLFVAVAIEGSALMLEKVRLAEFDVLLAAGVGVAVVATCVNLAKQRSGVMLWCVAYSGLLFGFLAKGAPALMAFLPGLLLAALRTGRWSRLFSVPHLIGFGVMFLFPVGIYLALAVSFSEGTALAQPAWEASWRAWGWGSGELLRTLVKPFLIVVGFLPWCLFVLVPLGPMATSMERLVSRAGMSFFLGGALAFLAVPTHEMRYYLPLGAGIGLCAGVHARDLLRGQLVCRWPLWLFRWLVGLVGAAVLIADTWRGGSVRVLVLLMMVLAAAAGLVPTGSDASRTLRAAVAVSLILAVGQGLVFLPRRAAVRDQSAVARELVPFVPSSSVVWVPGPADRAGKNASLLFYLRRAVRAFDPEAPPPQGSLVLVAKEELERLAIHGVEVDVLVEREAQRSTFVVGVVAGPRPRAAAASSGGK